MPKINDKKQERLTTTIQEMLDGNPSLLIGSGGSIIYGLPSMTTLATELKIKLEPMYHGKPEWIAFKHELSLTNNLEIALGKIVLSDEIHSSVISTIWALIDKKDREAIASFLKTGTSPSLSLLLNKFVQQTSPSNVITTNYDRIIEYAIDAARGNVETGFCGNCIKEFVGFQKTGKKRTIRLFKVHGSVDWFKHKENYKLISTSFFDQAELFDQYEPMIVTPGIKKYQETHNDPFRTVMAEADKALRSSTSYLCFGYGFNDEHIQPIIIDENRNKNKPIVIITKQITNNIREKFLGKNKYNCIIISENIGGGTLVNYSASDIDIFKENYWHLDDFYKLWLE